ncbi:MAG: glycosyltransferase [Dehalococcoidales bacterium]|nr:MAG: glycosyltransferase [Dehalococcoidales bacterium]
MTQPVCIITEDLSLPLDEGIKNFAHSLLQAWPPEIPVLGLSVHPRGTTNGSNVVSLDSNRLFLSYRLWEELRSFKPEIICYVPSASATVFSFLRSQLLKLYRPRARVVMVSLQPRRYGWLSRHLIRLLAPDVVFVQHKEVAKQLISLGCHAQLIPSGVDLEKFTPVPPNRKTELRTEYGLEPETFTVLHVGHIKRERNVQSLIHIRQELAAQVIVVGSTFPGQDEGLLSELREQGITVFDQYLPDIEHIYQLADCYVFPVISHQACIGAPLSVLEAMACNLPVVTLRYGDLPTTFEQGDGFFYAEGPEELPKSVAQTVWLNGCETREMVTPYSWRNIARLLLGQIELDG